MGSTRGKGKIMLTEERKNLIRSIDKFRKTNEATLAESTHRFWDEECECYIDQNEAQFMFYFSRCLRKRTLSEEWDKIKNTYREICRNEESIVPREFLNEILNELREIYFSSQN